MFRAVGEVEELVPGPDVRLAAPPESERPLEIPYAIRRFGHIYAVGVPTKKWRLVVVSDPELLDEVAGNEEQFGKPIEEINFFAQLQNTRGGGISVIGDGEHYESVRRVMLPWYSPQNQRTQLPVMKEQAQALVSRWAEMPAAEA